MSDRPRFHAEKSRNLIPGRSPDFQAKPFNSASELSAFPGCPSGMLERSIVLITVAGPRRTHTGFPFMPSRAPGMSEKTIPQSPKRGMAPTLGRPIRQRAPLAIRGFDQTSSASDGPYIAAKAQVRQRQRRDIESPEVLRRNAQGVYDRGSDHRRMRNRNCACSTF